PTPDPDPTPDYRPGVEGGSVTVEYVDENGNPLPGGETTTVKDKVPVGEAYTTEEKTFEGYHFVRMGDFSAAATGQVIEGVQHVMIVSATSRQGAVPEPEATTEPTQTQRPEQDRTTEYRQSVDDRSAPVKYAEYNRNRLA